jgi:hypothetical protein
LSLAQRQVDGSVRRLIRSYLDLNLIRLGVLGVVSHLNSVAARKCEQAKSQFAFTVLRSSGCIRQLGKVAERLSG